jgi:endonuclease G, mitochondrial
MNKSFVLLIFALFQVSGCAHGQTPRSDEYIVKRKFYELSYNEHHELANWVSYSLELPQLQNCTKRTNQFKSDPLVPSGTADLLDYRNSGFDRGHLLPAGDMKFDAQAMADTFYFSNIAPQPAGFNRGKWSQLEALVRAWALKYKKVWIATGPVLNNSLAHIGKKTQVSVPTEFYKVILRQEGSSYVGIGFLMSTDLPYPSISAYALDINAVEALTQIDFFSFLGSKEEAIEGTYSPEKWDFKATFDYLPCTSAARSRR